MHSRTLSTLRDSGESSCLGLLCATELAQSCPEQEGAPCQLPSSVRKWWGCPGAILGVEGLRGQAKAPLWLTGSSHLHRDWKEQTGSHSGLLQPISSQNQLANPRSLEEPWGYLLRWYLLASTAPSLIFPSKNAWSGCPPESFSINPGFLGFHFQANTWLPYHQTCLRLSPLGHEHRAVSHW